MSIFVKYKNHLFYAVILTFILISLDLVANLFYTNFYIYSTKFTLNQILITLFLTLIISFLTRKLRIIFTSLFILMGLTAIGYFAFFRSYIQFYHLQLIFTEYKDIVGSLSSISTVLVVIFISYLLLISFLVIMIKKMNLKESKKMNYVFLLLLFLLPIIIGNRPYIFLSNPLNFSYINMLYSTSLSANTLFEDNKNREFKSYKIEKTGSSKQNIILILGESLSYKRMHLYGYEKQNTPNLDKLKEKDNFFAIKAISAGINTPVAISTFFNIKREPQNMQVIYKEQSNLLKLAKDNGYKTYWLSTQEEGMSIASVTKFADVIKVKKDWQEPVFDDVLVDSLKNIDFSKKNFIVLHLRANHSPYEKYTPRKFKKADYKNRDYHTYKVNTYNESVLYVDYILSRMFKVLDNTKQNFKVYFTSDHGERLGYEDDSFKYGHSELDIEVAFVPFIVYQNEPINMKEKIVSHYQIGKMVAKDLGYIIINENEYNDTYFLNGVNITGKSGYIEYKLSELN